jgi:hypothetical protein
LDMLVSETLQAVVPKVFSDAGATVGFAGIGDVVRGRALQTGEGNRRCGARPIGGTRCVVY